MTDVHLIKIPGKLHARAQDDRGLPIPGIVDVTVCNPTYTALVPLSMVNYDILDWNAWAACAAKSLCSYCRHPHEYYQYLIGHHSEISAKMFVNPPMHLECAEYFLEVYPTVFMPRMRSAPIKVNGELPTRLGLYKTRDYKAMKPATKVGTTLNYMIRAGTQIGSTTWIEYPRDLMVMFNQREIALRTFIRENTNNDEKTIVESLMSIYLNGQLTLPN